jgi:hypothetical protein
MTYKVKCNRAKTVTTLERNIVLKMIKQCMTELNRPKHEIAQSGTKFSKPFDLEIRDQSSGNSGHANEECIMINIHNFKKGNTRLWEYAAYISDPVIGGREEGATPESVLLALVAHEVAHHVQYAYAPMSRVYKKSYRKAHGHGFQDIYRILRANVVNPKLDAKKITEEIEKIPFFLSEVKKNMMNCGVMTAARLI